MENTIKTLEQIQEEFKKKVSELNGEENAGETVLEKVRIDDVVEDFDIESEEKNLIIKDKEISLDGSSFFLEGEDFLDVEDDQLSEIIDSFKMQKRVKIVRIITTIIITLCIIGIVLGTAVFVVGKDPENEFFGYGFYPEYSETMSPKYERGDMVLYEAKGVQEIVAETTVGSYIVAYTNRERKELCVAQVERFVINERNGDVFYQIKADKDIIEEENLIHAHLVKGKAKFYPLKGFAFATYYVVRYVKYFAIGFFAPLVVAIVLRTIFGRKIEIEYDDDDEDFEEEDLEFEE